MPITDNNEEKVHHEEVIAQPEEQFAHYEEPIAQLEEQQNHVQANYNGSTIQVLDKTPIIFLFGPPSAGKTMTLVRLYRYFGKKMQRH